MTPEHYDEMIELWNRIEGVGLSDADSRDGVIAYLIRNPGLSLVATDKGMIIGAVLCGHDGRRGYLHHLAVVPERRGEGIGKALVSECLSRLGRLGIRKCNAFVFADNDDGLGFWKSAGWAQRADLTVIQGLT